jgi:hypothetical protein
LNNQINPLVQSVWCQVSQLRTLETRRGAFATVVQDEAKIDRQVKVDAQNVTLNGSAEANRSLKIDKSLEERTTFSGGWSANLHSLDYVQNICAHAKFQCICRAAATAAAAAAATAATTRWGRATVATGIGEGEEKEIEGEEKGKGGSRFGCHW